MAHEHVRICPVCGQENSPERARCACGALLAGIDFSLKPLPSPPGSAEDSAAAAPSVATPAAVPGIPDLPASRGVPADGAIVCPHADCAQPNPAGSERCVYCNRALRDAPESPALAGARPLPAALRDLYRVVDVFPASGSEADILLVADVRGGERRVAKLYRRGIAPDFRLLDILAQTVGDSVVHVLAHGMSDGAAYELLEFIPGGTLEDLLRAGPLTKADVRRIVSEIADALNGIHAHRILHRDLKPENVLIRNASPLELALTDFGIASLAAGTQHFTRVGRTTRYAAPEVLTGVLDAKSDWWSLGMIVLEAASGRHPFDGLTEQVMNLHLATRPIDVRGVYDDALRMLCRGLLLRDPKRRWGGAEVARWLAGDPTLQMADDAEGAATAVRPYRFGTTEATSGPELGLALAKHWDAARTDLVRGQIGRWVEQELHDYNLVRVLRDIQDQKGLSDDGRLLRFLLATAPDLPPVWCGAPVTAESILASARTAADGDEAARSWLDGMFRDGVLAVYGAAGQDALRDIDRAWRDAWRDALALWETARQAEDAFRKKPRDVGGGSANPAVSFDDIAFVASGNLAPPAQRELNGPLLLADRDAAYVDALRGEIVASLATIAGFCPWFEALWADAQHHPRSVVVARQLLTYAQEDAAAETRRQAATAEVRSRGFNASLVELRNRLAEVLALVPRKDESLPLALASQLLDALNRFQNACQIVLGHQAGDQESDAIRRAVEKLSALGLASQRALTEAEEIGGVNALFLAPQRLAIGGAILAGAVFLRAPPLILLVVAAVAVAAGYRWYMGFRATEAVLAKLRLFGLHGRTFLRPEPGDGSGKSTLA